MSENFYSTTTTTTNNNNTNNTNNNTFYGCHHLNHDHYYMNQIQQALSKRRQKGTLRRLPYSVSDKIGRFQYEDHDPSVVVVGMDFSSNDYLGLAQSLEQHERVQARFQELIQRQHQVPPPIGSWPLLGATGSRLLSGDHPYFHYVEAYLAQLHNRQVALLCNSGYDANLSLISSLPCQVILYDEYIHNSIHMGMRLWQAAAAAAVGTPETTATTPTPLDDTDSKRICRSFRHNSVSDLKQQLQQLHFPLPMQYSQSQLHSQPRSTEVMIVVESLYSMDGDAAPLTEILHVALEWGAAVVVDEAHALGVYGKRGMGLLAQLNLEQHPALFASVHTFGKGAGCHGAVLCCNHASIKDYWINFAYPLIYSTALPLHSLVTIQVSYETMACPDRGTALRRQLQRNIQHFQILLCQALPNSLPRHDSNTVFLMPSDSPIQALRIAGNDVCTEFCARLKHLSKGALILFPIKSPTVPAGQERVRIVVHAHNTEHQIQYLVQCIRNTLQQMRLLPSSAHSRL